jgi:hypothetical protein
MCVKTPKDPQEMLAISGVRQKELESYGHSFSASHPRLPRIKVEYISTHLF